MVTVDSAVYVAGRRIAAPGNLERTVKVMRERAGMAWIELYRFEADEAQILAEELRLPASAVQAALL